MAFNWGSIASLQKLKKLQVSINYADPSIFVEAVSHLTALQTLDIWDCKRVHFSPIYGWNWENWIHLTNLRELNLHSAHHLHHESLMDMAVLSNLAALEVTGKSHHKSIMAIIISRIYRHTVLYWQCSLGAIHDVTA